MGTILIFLICNKPSLCISSTHANNQNNEGNLWFFGDKDTCGVPSHVFSEVRFQMLRRNETVHWLSRAPAVESSAMLREDVTLCVIQPLNYGPLKGPCGLRCARQFDNSVTGLRWEMNPSLPPANNQQTDPTKIPDFQIALSPISSKLLPPQPIKWLLGPCCSTRNKFYLAT